MRVRLVTAGVAVAAILAAGCGLGNIAGKSDSSGPSVPTAAPSGSILIQKPQKNWDADGKVITPTAIVLHWWDGWGDGHDIMRLVADANGNKTNYDPTKKSTDKRPIIGHVTVQIGVTGDGKAYQLTPKLNSFARHAKCANWWAIGVEIEGYGPAHSHYIGDNKTQFNGVVAVVKLLMSTYHIKPESFVADDGKSGRGVVSHKMVDEKCQWADGKPAGEGKTDVDNTYLKRVLTAVGG